MRRMFGFAPSRSGMQSCSGGSAAGIGDLQTARELLIPELYVLRLMSTAFEHIVAAIV